MKWIKKEIPEGASIKEIRKYLLDNNYVIEATFDPIFKAVMGSCCNYLADLIFNITGIDKELLKKTFNEKNVEYKVSNALERKKTSDFIFECRGYIINLECNNNYWEGLIERNEAYFSKIKGELLNRSEKYSKDIKVIQINFDIFDEYEKILGKEGITNFKIRNELGVVETESSVKYHINVLESLRKYYEGRKLTKLDKELVILILDDYKEILKISEGSVELMEAAEKIYSLTSDIDNIGLYDIEKRRREEEEMRLEYRSKIAIEEGLQEGLQKGLQKGLKEGRKEGVRQGVKQEKHLIAKKLLDMGISMEKVIEATGLSEKQISKLKY